MARKIKVEEPNKTNVSLEEQVGVPVTEHAPQHPVQAPGAKIDGDDGVLAHNPTPGAREAATAQAEDAMRTTYTPAQLAQNPNLF